MQFIVDRAVANGPVDLTVTGPIIKPVIKTFFWSDLAGIIMQTAFLVSILFLPQRSRRMRTLMIRFVRSICPSHMASRQSSSFDGWERPPGARGVCWHLQHPSNRRRDSHDGNYRMCSSGTSEQVSQTVLQ